MVDAIYIDNNRVQVVKNNDISFDTARPSVKLIEDAKIVINERQVTFPSLLMRRAYYRNVTGTGGTITVCQSWSTLIWQEWGPGEGYNNERYFRESGIQDTPGPTTRNLPRETLGSVPAETNYLDVRIRLRRFQTPPKFIEYEPPFMYFPENEWLTLAGESCPVEGMFYMRRHLDIVRSGTGVYLDRYQSVQNADTLNAPLDNPQSDINGTANGWNSTNNGGVASDGSTNLVPKSNYYLASMIESKADANGNKRPNGTNACSTAYPDLTSNYSVDLVITPGIYRT